MYNIEVVLKSMLLSTESKASKLLIHKGLV